MEAHFFEVWDLHETDWNEAHADKLSNLPDLTKSSDAGWLKA